MQTHIHAELKDLFEYSQFKTDYDFFVRMTNETCFGCQNRKPVLNFEVMFACKIPVGDFGFLIDKENGILKDIFRCRMYKECHGVWLDPYQPMIRVAGGKETFPLDVPDK